MDCPFHVHELVQFQTSAYTFSGESQVPDTLLLVLHVVHYLGRIEGAHADGLDTKVELSE